MCAYIIVFIDIMSLWPQWDKIQALCDRLCDELPKLDTSGSIEKLDVYPNKGIDP